MGRHVPHAETVATTETDLVRALVLRYTAEGEHSDLAMAVVVAREIAFVAGIHQGDTGDALRNQMARFIAEECQGACAMDPVQIPHEPLRMMAKWREIDLLRSYEIDSPHGMIDAALATGLWPTRHRQGQDVTDRQRRALDRLSGILDDIAKRRAANDYAPRKTS